MQSQMVKNQSDGQILDWSLLWFGFWIH